MMTPDDLREWAGKRHAEYLRAVAAGEAFFPKEVRFGRPSPTEDFGKLKAGCDALAARCLPRGLPDRVGRAEHRAVGTAAVPIAGVV